MNKKHGKEEEITYLTDGAWCFSDQLLLLVLITDNAPANVLQSTEKSYDISVMRNLITALDYYIFPIKWGETDLALCEAPAYSPPLQMASAEAGRGPPSLMDRLAHV